MSVAFGDPTVAADALGHSDTATTLRHYITRHRTRPEVAGIMQQAVVPAADATDAAAINGP